MRTTERRGTRTKRGAQGERAQAPRRGRHLSALAMTAALASIIALAVGEAPLSALAAPAAASPVHESGEASEPRLHGAERWPGFGAGHAPRESSASTNADVGIDETEFPVLPSAEINLLEGLSVPAFEGRPSALSDGAGGVCVLALEGFALRAMISSDGGATFPSETDVLDASSALDVVGFEAALAPSGSVLVALVIADPAGGIGVQAVRSTDFCATWGAPIDIVRSGEPGFGVHDLAIAGGDAGRATIAFIGDDAFAPYAATSLDDGVSFGAPVRVDPDLAPSTRPTTEIDVVFDGSTPHVAFVQDRTTRDGQSLLLTRSLDDGASFEAPFDTDALRTQVTVRFPRLTSPQPGVVLVGYWALAADGSGPMNVLRSADAGVTWSSSTPGFPYGFAARFSEPSWITFPASDNILLVYDRAGNIDYQRSTDGGASFGLPLRLDDTACGLENGDPLFPVSAASSAGASLAVTWVDCEGSADNFRTDIKLRRSSDEGASFSPEERVDSDAPNAALSDAPSIVSPASDDFFVTWRDRRGGDQNGLDLYASRSLAGAAFDADTRIDTDQGTSYALSAFPPTLAHDGAGRVYAAFQAGVSGHDIDIYVRRSDDGGRTFGPAVRVGSSPAGEVLEIMPVVAAASDGGVHVAWIHDKKSPAQREIRVASSSDFGETWSADQVLGTVNFEQGIFYYPQFPAVDVVALEGGVAYVAWSNSDDVFLARSFDAGATFDIDDVDQSSNTNDRLPRICAQGDQIILVMQSPDLAFAFYSVWGTVSEDRGETWDPRVQLRPEGIGGGAGIFELACDGAGRATAFWSDGRGGLEQIYRSRFDGTAWSADALVPSPAGEAVAWPRAAYASDNELFVAYESRSGGAFVTSSTDGGASFGSVQRLDEGVSRPGAPAFAISIAANALDAATRVWVAWYELTAASPLGDMVVRYSGDGGASFGPIERLSGARPEGASNDIDSYPFNEALSVEGRGLFNWAAARGDTQARAPIVAVYDPEDLDGDGVSAEFDCDDTDPGVGLGPKIVSGVTLEKGAGGETLMSWDEDPADADGTTYDVARGALGTLLSTGAFGDASCLATGLTEPTYTDTSAPPAPGEGTWDLVRAVNACGEGSYGDSSLDPDPRDDLDASSPCP